jgi:hypothetical protein
VENAKSYLVKTEPATEGLFKLLNKYGWHKMRAIVEICNSQTRDALKVGKANYASIDIARDVIAGSILQIAYSAINQYAAKVDKPDSVLKFESKINTMLAVAPNARCKHFELRAEFCVGRNLGELPIGLVIYAARNQYNHFGDKRLLVANEVIFDYLNLLWPEPVKNDLSFNLRNKKYKFYSYAALCALGWVDSSKRLGYQAYKEDMGSILEVKF